jgi:hypothetical protein
VVASRISRRRSEEERADTLHRLRATTNVGGFERNPRRSEAKAVNTCVSVGSGRFPDFAPPI